LSHGVLLCVVRAEGPFSEGWRDPNSRHYTNVPVHSADGDTDPAVPFSPMGFADITGGLRGSRQSLDRAPDDRPAPTRGSNRSLNRSQDSATVASGNPRTRGRDAAAARGSNRSLNRSVCGPSLLNIFLVLCPEIFYGWGANEMGCGLGMG